MSQIEVTLNFQGTSTETPPKYDFEDRVALIRHLLHIMNNPDNIEELTRMVCVRVLEPRPVRAVCSHRRTLHLV